MFLYNSSQGGDEVAECRQGIKEMGNWLKAAGTDMRGVVKLWNLLLALQHLVGGSGEFGVGPVVLSKDSELHDSSW